MRQRILFVDDDARMLWTLRRLFEDAYEVVAAPGALEGLAVLREQGGFSVIVSDMAMPEMDGVHFLAQARAIDPDAIRMVLSGEAELDHAVDAVNRGSISRFLRKPPDREQLLEAVAWCVQQHDLVMAERRVLEETLGGVAHLLADVLSMASPPAASRSSSIERIVGRVVEELGVPMPWELRLASMLSYLGCLSVPLDVLREGLVGGALSADDQELFREHPLVARRLLSVIPRLEPVAELVGTLTEAGELPEGPDPKAWDPSALARQVLLAAVLFSSSVASGRSRPEALAEVRETGRLHPAVMSALTTVKSDPVSRRAIGVAELREGMVLEADARTPDGRLLLATGHQLTEAIVLRLRNYARHQQLAEPIVVRV